MNPLVKVGNSFKLSNEFLEELTIINNDYAKKKYTFSSYAKTLQKLCGIDKCIPITHNYKQFLGGFILVKGSLNANVKKKEVKLGLAIDLEFSVTQSFFGVSHLINLLLVFHTGRISYKSGSNATLVYEITNRQTIFEKVFHFWDKYIYPYQPSFEATRYINFKEFESLFRRKVHLNQKEFCEDMLPLWDSLQEKEGQSNQVFRSLEEAIKFVNQKNSS